MLLCFKMMFTKMPTSLTSHPIMLNLHSLRDDLIPIRKTTDGTIWWRYLITKKKETKLKSSPPIADMLSIKTQTFS